MQPIKFPQPLGQYISSDSTSIYLIELNNNNCRMKCESTRHRSDVFIVDLEYT